MSSKEIAVKEKNELVVPEAGFGIADDASADDIIVPRFAIMQNLSPYRDKVEGGKVGDLVDLEEMEILPRPLECIAVHLEKNWKVKDEEGEFIRSEPFDARDPRKEYEFEEDGVTLRRKLFYNFFCLLPQVSMDFPYLFSCGGNSENSRAAKSLITKCQKLQTENKPSWSIVFELNTGNKKEGKKDYWYFIQAPGRETTKEERDAAVSLAMQIRNARAKFVVNESVVEPEEEIVI
jgi:hypothetical protein